MDWGAAFFAFFVAGTLVGVLGYTVRGVFRS